MTDDLLTRLGALDASILSDVLDVAGFGTQVLAGDIVPLDPTKKLVGRAFCARGEPVPTGAGGISPYEVENSIGRDEVAVICMNGHRVGAVAGGFVVTQLRNRGAAGILTDGGVRDSAEIIELGFPVFSAVRTPANSAGRWAITATGVPVHLPGLAAATVEVRPGDFILGDRDGTVVIPQEHIEAVLAAAEELSAIERVIVEEIRTGSSRQEAFARHPRFKHIPRLRG